MFGRHASVSYRRKRFVGKVGDEERVLGASEYGTDTDVGPLIASGDAAIKWRRIRCARLRWKESPKEQSKS